MNKQTKQLLNENNALDKQLKGNYTVALTDIVVYIRSANISEYQQEVVRHDITQIMIDGMRRGDSPEDIIGGDYKLFCDNVISELPQLKPIQKAITMIRDIFLMLAILLTIWFCFELIEIFMSDVTWPYLPVTIGDLINTGLIISFAAAFVTILCKKSFNAPEKSIKFTLSLVGIMIVLVIVNLLLNKVIFTIHAFIVIIGVLILFTVSKIIDRQVLL